MLRVATRTRTPFLLGVGKTENQNIFILINSTMVSSANCNVFVYGSPLADDVARVLLSRVPPSSPAILPHYHRFSIKGRVYPAKLPVENKKVIGKVLSGITPSELDILDSVEDDEYERRTVDAFLKDSSE